MNNSFRPAIAKSEANRPFGNVRCLSEKSPEHCVKIIYSKWRIRKIRIRRVRRNISSALKPVKLKGEQAKCIYVPLFQSIFTSFFLFSFPWKKHLVRLDLFPQRPPVFSSAPEEWPPRRLLFPFQLFPLSAYEPYHPRNTGVET